MVEPKSSVADVVAENAMTRYLPIRRVISDRLTRLAPNLQRLGIKIDRRRTAQDRPIVVTVTL